MRRLLSLAVVLLAVVLLAATSAGAAPCGIPQNPADLGIDLSQQAQCDPLVPEHCLMPFPNDYFTVQDGATRTHRRIAFVADALPKNTGGAPLDAAELNQADGFSPGSALLLW